MGVLHGAFGALIVACRHEHLGQRAPKQAGARGDPLVAVTAHVLAAAAAKTGQVDCRRDVAPCNCMRVEGEGVAGAWAGGELGFGGQPQV